MNANRSHSAEERHHLAGRRILTVFLLFGIAFGYVEAAVVVYLRALYEPMKQRLQPDAQPGDLFPLIGLDELKILGPEPQFWLIAELGREAATLLLLASISLAIARTFRQWFAGFLLAFGLWDIFYYVFLKVLLDWPSSLLTWDLLFLLPVPWAGPVLAPMLVALSMIIAGVITLRRESLGPPLRLGAGAWTAIVSGGVLIVLAFCQDYRNLLAAGRPAAFNWLLFGVGEAIGFGGFLAALAPLRRRESTPAPGGTASPLSPAAASR